MTKQIERVCGNCRLYDAKNQVCSVIILYEGLKQKVPMDPEDKCLYETEYFDPVSKKKQDFVDEIQEVKIWLENEKGQKVRKKRWWEFWRMTEKISVKMEYPQNFFGED